MKTIKHCYTPNYFYVCPKCKKMYWDEVECDCDSNKEDKKWICKN